MAYEKQLRTRIVHKHDTPSHWELAENFIPMQGELIIYDDRTLKKLENGSVVTDQQLNTPVRYKIGDGVTNVNDLPFVNVGESTEGMEFTVTTNGVTETVIGGEGAERFNGHANIASGKYSHAEGFSTKASGDYSHAEGYTTTASGSISHAEGSLTRALGGFSHAEGLCTVAASANQHVQGTSNIEDAEGKYAHIVGNGANILSPSNAHTLDWDGVAWFAGDVKVGGTGQDDENAKTLATTEQIDAINDIIGTDDSILGTWVFNDEPDLSTLNNASLVFASNGTEYNAIRKVTAGNDAWGIYTLSYFSNNVGQVAFTNNPDESYGIAHGWTDEVYKTITITEAPTDETFITWLKNNATKQSETIFERINELENKAASSQVSITHSELVALRDNSELTPGAFYRITDYQCTTVQENTRAMNNKFDIIVQALSSNTLSEIAKVDYHFDEEGNAYGYETITHSPNLNITWYYTITRSGYEADTTTFGDLGHDENNEGITVPVLYRLDDEEINYTDKYFYIDTYVHDDMQCSRWRLIEGGEYTGSAESGLHDWENDTNRKYILTNLVVEDGEFTIEDASEVETLYTIYDDDEGSYAKEEDNHNDTIVETGFAENNEGITVPVLYKTNLDSYSETDYEDKFYYVGRYEYLGETYDRWRKIEIDGSTGEEKWDNTFRYILTSIAVDENGQFLDSVFSGESYVETVKVANLPAWELKYCLDNDISRFAWADEENGRGVIYYMKDEHNNECPYDFKNIQFKRDLDWQNEHSDFIENLGISKGDAEWFYTFSWINENLEIEDLTLRQDLLTDDPMRYGTYNNKINTYLYEDEIGAICLNNILMINSYHADGGLFYGCYSNTFGNHCHFNTFGDSCRNNTFGNNCHFNTFGNYCNSNTFNISCWFNTFGNSCKSNTFNISCWFNTFGDSCESNIFGNDCRYNTFGNYCKINTLGNACSNNTFGDECRFNTFGDEFGSNTFGNGCYNNTFGNGCGSNIFGIYCNSNTLGNDCYDNTFGNECNSNTFGNECRFNTFGDFCESNAFGNNCYFNAFGNYCYFNTFGNYCYNNTFSNSKTETITYVKYVRFENGCQYIKLLNSETGSLSNYVQDIVVSAGVRGTSDAYHELQVSRNAPPVVYEAAGTTHIILD